MTDFTRPIACAIMACIGAVDIMLGFYIAIVTIEYVMAENMSDTQWSSLRYLFEEKKNRAETIKMCKKEITCGGFLIAVMVFITMITGAFLV